MPVRLDNPHELGADRLVNAIAAYDRFGSACAGTSSHDSGSACRRLVSV
jgi:pantothenate kinase type III